MADLKISELDAVTPLETDLIAIERTTTSPNENGKVTLGDILDELSGLPAAPVSAGDYVLSLAGSPLAATWETAASGGAGVPAVPESAGTYALVMSGSPLAASWDTISSAVYDVAMFRGGTPGDGERIFAMEAATAFALNDDFAGSVGYIGTNPTASYVLTVKAAGATVGTVTVSTGGAFTFATSGGAVSVAIGDLFEVVSQATADATAADVAVTFKGVAT